MTQHDVPTTIEVETQSIIVVPLNLTIFKCVALVPCAHGGFVAPAVVAAPAAAAVEEAPGVSVEKREAEPVGEATADAEADPEADPWLYYSGLYGGHYGYAAHHYAPFSYSYAPYTYRHAYAHYGLPYAYYGKK